MNPFRLSTRLQPARDARSRAARDGARGDGGDGSGAAVEVPWRVTARSASGVVEVRQCGEGPLHSVRFSLAGDGLLGLSLPRTVLPGETLRVVVRGPGGRSIADSAEAMLVLRWFEPDGREFLWPVAL